MKTKFNLLLFFFIFCFANAIFSQCPVKGDSKSAKLQHLDSLKNRTTIGNMGASVSLSDVFTSGSDENRFSNNQYISITAVIKKVKYGGVETCECHDKDKNDFDYHIEVLPENSASDALPMICEINRYNRCVSYDSLKTLVGKKVKIIGWLFWDAEHWQNAQNSNPSGTNLWRQTSWEIHPVINIEIVK